MTRQFCCKQEDTAASDADHEEPSQWWLEMSVGGSNATCFHDVISSGNSSHIDSLNEALHGDGGVLLQGLLHLSLQLYSLSIPNNSLHTSIDGSSRSDAK